MIAPTPISDGSILVLTGDHSSPSHPTFLLVSRTKKGSDEFHIDVDALGNRGPEAGSFFFCRYFGGCRRPSTDGVGPIETIPRATWRPRLSANPMGLGWTSKSSALTVGILREASKQEMCARPCQPDSGCLPSSNFQRPPSPSSRIRPSTIVDVCVPVKGPNCVPMRAHAHTRARTRARTRTHARTHMCTVTCGCMYARMHTCMHVYIHVHICMHACVYACMHKYYAAQ